MISLEQLREIDPKCKDIPDAELIEIRSLLYSAGELALEVYFADKKSEKI